MKEWCSLWGLYALAACATLSQALVFVVQPGTLAGHGVYSGACGLSERQLATRRSCTQMSTAPAEKERESSLGGRQSLQVSNPTQCKKGFRHSNWLDCACVLFAFVTQLAIVRLRFAINSKCSVLCHLRTLHQTNYLEVRIYSNDCQQSR